jgi:serine protease Do
LGLSGQPVTAEIAASLGLARPAGVLIKAVDARSPAGQSGLRVGDIVTALNGRAVDDPDALRFRAATFAVGSTVALDVMRRGSERQISFTLTAPPEDPPRDTTQLAGRNPLAGATVLNLSPAVADEIDFQGPPQGVVVLSLSRGSAAARLGFQPGDVVLRVNDQDVNVVRDLKTALRDRAGQWTVTIRRGDQVLNTIFR